MYRNFSLFCRPVIFCLLVFCLLLTGVGRRSGVRAVSREAEALYRGLPMVFEENRGQVAEEVRYLARGHGYQVFLTATEMVLVLARRDGAAGVATPVADTAERLTEGTLRLSLGGARAAEVVGLEPRPGRSHYLIGNDPAGWRQDIPQFGRVGYQEVYPGISMAVYGHQQSVEYDFIVAPGADPGAIELKIEGAERIETDPGGDLVLTVGGERVYQRSPRIYQELEARPVGGRAPEEMRRPVSGRYRVGADGRVGFEVDDYDRSRPLVIDPVIDYSTFIGGVGSDEGLAIAIDGQRNIYVTGTTYSNNFNVLTPFQTSNRGGKFDAFVTKIDAAGTGIVYSTYLGGSSEDEGRGIVVNGQGQVFVAGITNSVDFNTRNAWQGALNGLAEDAFVAKIDAAGSGLIFSTYLGGSNIDQAFALALDSGGNVLVAGSTNSADFKLKGAVQSQFRGNYDGFLARFRGDGNDLISSTYLGGTGFEEIYGVAVDAAGNALVTGVTASTDYPVVGPLQTQNRGGGGDAFVTKVNAAGTAILWSTWLGGSGIDIAYGIAVDAGANVYLTGHTFSTDYPVVRPLQAAPRGGAEAFLTKINPGGTALVYSTWLGGSAGDFGRGVAVDSGGYAVVVGRTVSTDFNTFNALQGVNRGDFDAFVARVAPGGDQFVYSTYLGGSVEDFGLAVAVDTAGNAYVTGDTFSTNFNTKSPLQATNRGGFDAFVAKINSAGTGLEFSTYLGGSGEDLGLAMAVDAAGSAYLTGYTSSSDFPTRSPIQANSRGGLEVFVTKIFADASDIAFNTYLGGSGSDTGAGIAVDQGGSIYLVGSTASANFPTRGAIQAVNRGGLDTFVAKLNAAGSNLIYATYLGGGFGDLGRGIAVDPAGLAWVVGSSFSTDFPVVGAFQATSRGGGDAFVARLNAAGSQLMQASYLGGAGLDEATGVAVNSQGDALVVGTTSSTDFPVRNPLQGVSQGQQDIFVTRVAANGAGLIYSTYLGGGLNDVGNGIAVDQDGNAYVTGATASNDFPRRGAWQSTYGGGDFDAVLLKLNPGGSALLFSTYLGGRLTDIGTAVAVDRTSSVFVAGITGSPDLPLRSPLQAENRGGNEAFLAQFSADGARLIFSSYLGGAGDDRGYGVAVGGQGIAYLVGATTSADFNIQFPLLSYGGGTDTFVAKVIADAVVALTPTALELQVGTTGTMTVTLNAPAATDVSLVLSTGEPGIVRIPSSLTIPAGAVNATFAVTAAALGGPVTITVLWPDGVGGATAEARVTVVASSRHVQAADSRVAAGGLLTVPIELEAQGNESRVSFSLALDPAVFITPQFLLGSDATNATLITGFQEESQGRYGISLVLPAGETFESGRRQLMLIQTVVATGTGVTAASIGFIDQPTLRRIDDRSGIPVRSSWFPGTVTISQGYEGDVAPRPNGSNGTVTIADWVQTGRFVASLDAPAAGSEFQRVDTAPRLTFGNGLLTVADWVQTGRYAAALDPIVSAGGPATPLLAVPARVVEEPEKPGDLVGELAGSVRLVSVPEAGTQMVTLNVEYQARGDENAISFSLRYDPRRATLSAVAAGAALADGVLNTNLTPAGEGRLGFAMALPPGRTLAAGDHRLLTIRMRLAAGRGPRSLPVEFDDHPIRRELVTVRAEPLVPIWGGVAPPRRGDGRQSIGAPLARPAGRLSRSPQPEAARRLGNSRE